MRNRGLSVTIGAAKHLLYALGEAGEVHFTEDIALLSLEIRQALPECFVVDGEKDHWYRTRGRVSAQLLEYFDAIHLGHTNIEDNELRPSLLDHTMGYGSI